MMNFLQLIVSALLISEPLLVRGDIAWPEYNQQCRDDAGTLYLDDEETYGSGGKYHDGQAAFPVLVDGECAPKMKDACEKRGDAKTAYLEGPLDCGSDGWFCRIIPDPNWPAKALTGDLNFGHCNSTEAFEDAGYDGDGHCHGSSASNTYYWWVRDHFFRQYNGRLRCCCGWYDNAEDSSQSLYGGSDGARIANRCDYRRKVKKSEDLSQCRDANEGHGLGFDNIGCDSKFESQIGSPIPEDDGQCWEIGRFGYSEDAPPPSPTPPSPTPPSPTPPSPTPPSGDECEQSGSDKFFLRFKNIDGEKEEVSKSCNWLAKKSAKKQRKICKKTRGTDDYPPPKDVCYETCGTGPCDE